MKNIIYLYCYLILFAGNTYSLIPHAINNKLTQTVLKSEKFPWTSVFTKAQRQLIKNDYTNMLLREFQNEILESNSSKEEISAEVNRELNLIFGNNIHHSISISLDKLKDKIDAAKNKKENFAAQIKFKGIELPIFIEFLGNTININLVGIPYLGRTSCLKLEYDSLSANEPIELMWLGTQDPICPIPVEQKGTFLLELSEAIAKALGRKTITLWDASYVICPKNQKTVDLFLLKIFQQGKSWYESKGYSHIPEQEDKYRSKVNTLIQYKLIDFINDLNKSERWLSKLEVGSENYIKFQDYYKYLQEIKPSLDYLINYYNTKPNDGLLSSFLAWLYQADCAQYTILIDLLFPLEKFGFKYFLDISVFFPWKHNYYKIIK